MGYMGRFAQLLTPENLLPAGIDFTRVWNAEEFLAMVLRHMYSARLEEDVRICFVHPITRRTWLDKDRRSQIY